MQVVGLCPRPRSSALWCQDGFVNQEGGAFPLPGHPRWPLSQGFGPARRRPKPLVSYQTYRQLSGWDFHPLVIRAVGAHINIPVSKPRMTGNIYPSAVGCNCRICRDRFVEKTGTKIV